ncbi:hypothetical protein GQ44DRAFT_763612 [Phaeosphaeriaceae sp. PMI808]|nr:hypothetical protein GQ44DRAFT_763612 [Phaeosphaeriaceae sp. PMI808]
MDQPPRHGDAEPSPTQLGPSTVAPIQEHPGSPIDSASNAANVFVPPLKTALPVSSIDGQSLNSPNAADRVFPIRSVVSVDPTPTPKPQNQSPGDYFHPWSRTNDGRVATENRRLSQGSTASFSSQASQRNWSQRQMPPQTTLAEQSSTSRRALPQSASTPRNPPLQLPSQLFTDLSSNRSGEDESRSPSLKPEQPPLLPPGPASIRSKTSSLGDVGLVTHRFTHATTGDGHMIITGRDGDVLQRCEDEPIHIPGAIQGFGLVVALAEDTGDSGNLIVRIVSENSKRVIGHTPKELFALESFTDILSDEQADNLLDHIDFIKDEDSDILVNGPEVFTIAIKVPGVSRTRKLWCAIHITDANPGLIVCEFELEDDPQFPLVTPSDLTPELPEDTLSSNPTAEEFLESTEIKSKPLRVLRSARKRKGEAAAMEVFNIMSQVQEQLAAAPNLDKFLKVLVGVVKELTGFHRVMIYQFDQSFNGRVVTELVDPRATKDLYKGLNFPASDIPKQARELYKVNRVRMLYDRDQETARLVCRTAEDLEHPLDMTHSYLRAIKYGREVFHVDINQRFWRTMGLIACHSYGPRGMRVSFPIRKMCRMVGDSSSRNIERLSYASRLQARKLINTVPTSHNPSGYIIASSDDLLKLFDADFGLLSIRDETKILGDLENPQEALALLEYLRMRNIQSIMTSMDITEDFPDLRYPPGFHVIAGLLVVPLAINGTDFIVFFRRGQRKEVKWAGNPYEKFFKEGTEGYLEPRKSFKTWSETVTGKCRDWTEEEIETASVLCLVYGKFIEVWRQKEAALQNSQLTRLLLANSAHEVRTPLNAIINYLEIALEGSLDTETRENLARSHSASKSLIYVINDLLDLTKTEEGGSLIKGESFDLKATIKEATDMFRGDAKRKGIGYEVIEYPGLPQFCLGDQRRVRQAISNIAANAIQSTTEGSVTVEVYVAAMPDKNHVDVEVAVTDTGIGMDAKKLDQLFYDLEQVHSETTTMLEDALIPNPKQIEKKNRKTVLGLGLAVVARIIKTMDGQLRIRSEEGKGTRFVVQFPFDLPDSEGTTGTNADEAAAGPPTPQPHTPSLRSTDGERTMIAPSLSRNASEDHKSESRVMRRSSADSLKSKTSLRSFKSGSSHKSDVDRLIDAIQEPHMVGRIPQGTQSPTAHSLRPSLTKRNSIDSDQSPRIRSKSLEHLEGRTSLQPHQRNATSKIAGEEQIESSGVPLKAVRMPDEGFSLTEAGPERGSILGEIRNEPQKITASPENLTAEHMRVLVAEDDPVNSRIVKKRLERLGHDVYLTVNGEECASAFGDKPQNFDVVLMDMQRLKMPIVDGLTATKMIRSYEKTHSNIYSTRAALCGRIPIIAVSASLVERDRQHYIDAGFDAWILKPIPFDRLNKLISAIVDKTVRNEYVYQPGQWERGGWFHKGEKSSLEAVTKPSNEPPTSISAPTSYPTEKHKDVALPSGHEVSPSGDGTDKRAPEPEGPAQNPTEDNVEPPITKTEDQPPA